MSNNDNNEPSEGSIIGFGNPLLDISAAVTPEFLAKYEMEPNNAILASDKQIDLSQDLADNFKVDYIAGGAVQNAMRVAQWFFARKQVATFMGAVGVDKFANEMRARAEGDGVRVAYQVVEDTPTGTCACLISNNGKNRSLCAFLGASQKFTIDFIHQNWELVEQAKLIYVSGFYLIVSIEASVLLAKHCLDNPHKKLVFNLSAPYISQFYSPLVFRVMPYVELLFGNETEAIAFAEVAGWQTTDIAQIAQRLADYERKTAARTVVITQGVDDVLVAHNSETNIPLGRYPVEPLKDDEIVDTNGAGDAFVGGYLAMLIQDRPVDVCVQAGIYAAKEIIQRNGCSIPEHNIHRI